ncbi:carotenoid isomerooxygenase [Copidosoma floridanum]|uniref:carotenoid isomerooxygenase n=1 Tax=Copidosoma floridanum TaxID=29053 RepID=UPI0006C9DE30|nr:carotenoid isomerooxygenase [Copidosoma floridanum]
MRSLNCCLSCNRFDTSKLKVIEDLLDKTAPTLMPCTSPVFQKDVLKKSIILNNRNKNKDTKNDSHNTKIDDDQRKEEISYFYPNLDTTIWSRTCEKEVIEPLTGIITGHIPNWLNGTLLRNGPGSLEVGSYKFEHLFDSSALLHRYEINNGKITYQNRFIQTDVYKKNHAAKRIVVTEFGTRRVPDPCQSIFSKISSIFRSADASDNTMISVYPFNDEYYTFTEYPIIHRIDPKSLETLDKVNLAKYVNIVSHTSHPHVMRDGTVYNLGMTTTSRGPAYSIVRFPPSKFSEDNGTKIKKLSMFDQAEIVATVLPRWIFSPSYMHTFGITTNFFIIVEQPLTLSLKSIFMQKLRNDPLCAAFRWFGNEDSQIHLVSRKNGKAVKTFVTEAFFFLHIINQYETQDGLSVILDICCYRDPKILDCMFVEAIENAHENPDYSKFFRGRPLRFILPLKDSELRVLPEIGSTKTNNVNIRKSGRKKKLEDNKKNVHDVLQKKSAAFKLPNAKAYVVPELLCDLGCETPQINYKFNVGRKYRYFYAICSDVDRENSGMLVKVDTELKTKLIWCERNVYPSEPIFVPDPEGKNEDDGIVLSSLIWGQERKTQVALLILNAVTFEEVARATFETPSPVPKCLHGWFSSLVP